VEPIANEEWVGKMLVSLSKADNFEMTLMFVEDTEKELLQKIVEKLPSSVKDTVKSKYDV